MVSKRLATPRITHVCAGLGFLLLLPHATYAQVVAAEGDRPQIATRPSDVTDERVVRLSARRVSLNVRDALVQDVLDDAASQAGLKLIFAQSVVSDVPRVTLRVTDVPVSSAFGRILLGINLRVVITPNGVASLVRQGDVAQIQADTGSIQGTIVDSATKQGIARVTVTVTGTRLSAVTAADGSFLLHSVPSGGHTLTAKLLGYRAKVTDVTVGSDEPASVRIVLAPTATLLTGVVTTATGTQRRLDVGNDITKLDVDSLRQRAPITSVTDLLDGNVPGLVVQRGGGAPGSPARVRIRGVGSINATNDPIVILNGVRRYSNQTNKPSDTEYSVLDNIDINSIATIEVLKGPSASALYGSDAANGVIVITTKRGPGRGDPLGV